MSQKPSQILENLKTALPAIVQHIKDGWDNVQSLLIKTNSSVSLPIWTCNLDDSNEGRWDGLTAKVEGEQVDEEEVESDAEPSPEVKRTDDAKAKAKGKKRVSENHKNEEDEPNKKRKKNADDASKRTTKDSPLLLEPTPPKNKASVAPQTKKTSKSNKAAKQERKKIDPGSESDASGMVPI